MAMKWSEKIAKQEVERRLAEYQKLAALEPEPQGSWLADDPPRTGCGPLALVIFLAWAGAMVEVLAGG